MKCLPALAVPLSLVLVACGGGSTGKDAASLGATTVPTQINVTSDAFTNNAAIPAANTCDGPGPAPTISWGPVPDKTKSVAVVVDDPDAPSGAFVHWIVTGLPAKDGHVPFHASGVYELDNTGGTRGWTPPCPPAGKVHHYRFTVYALRDYVCATNGDETGTPGCSPPSAADALGQIRDSAIAKGTLVGTYKR